MLEQDSVKSVSGERVLYLNDEALDALQHLYEITGKNTYVISTQSGKSVQPSTIDRMMRTVLVRAGIPKGSNQGVHALRHPYVKPATTNNCSKWEEMRRSIIGSVELRREVMSY